MHPAQQVHHDSQVRRTTPEIPMISTKKMHKPYMSESKAVQPVRSLAGVSFLLLFIFGMLSKLSDFQMTMTNGDDNGKNAYMRTICSIDPFDRFTNSRPISEPIHKGKSGPRPSF